MRVYNHQVQIFEPKTKSMEDIFLKFQRNQGSINELKIVKLREELIEKILSTKLVIPKKIRLMCQCLRSRPKSMRPRPPEKTNEKKNS